MNDEQVEKIVQDKGLDKAPRVTLDYIKSRVKVVTYQVFHGRLTLCVIELKNGFLVTGESSAVSVENFDQELGEQIAYKNALDKVWMLEGYLLRDRTFNLNQLTSFKDTGAIA